jgi:hippurate hydrolase
VAEGIGGTVRFLFQPAGEWGRGALAMIEDGLLDRFPFEEMYGIHNMPGLEVGAFRTRPGAFMSAEDNFEIVLRGMGGHAARPDQSRETPVAACDLVMRLQTIVSRRLEPTDPAVVSVPELITDGTRNALPGMARILGDARRFAPEVSERIETELRRIAESTAAGYGLRARGRDRLFRRVCPPPAQRPAARGRGAFGRHRAVGCRQGAGAGGPGHGVGGFRPVSRPFAGLFRVSRQWPGVEAAAQSRL